MKTKQRIKTIVGYHQPHIGRHSGHKEHSGHREHGGHRKHRGHRGHRGQ